ncbi:WD-40 repeat protein [Candidatus Rhodobacter oscarellae]|uniref:WD-40 repeat protein n=1 Tax=Candidatus Rhodobacter oscarellae TaxID=1675527 RepID=A0A0J9H5E4_9RHOB|nr:hypothetical protein [Candidatus Rhodobacter lobularis]KMW60808.1 WD-40 repeat protein [Candidatus Rhodobacter lobularis]
MSEPTRPYPGLRPFQQDDREIFFGRDAYTMEILDRLARDERFVAVVGESGSGKSSLVRAGVIPALHAGMLDGSSDPWIIARMEPGDSPVTALAEALAEVESETPKKPYPSAAEFELTLNHSSRGLVNAEMQLRRFGPDGARLMLLVDQFEEVFQYGNENTAQRNEAAAFVQLLVNAVAAKSTEIYIILTMRLDFLRSCAQFPRLSETLNTGQYLVPPMHREERRLAVTEPAKVFGKTVSHTLVERVLNDIGDAADQLPVMQHVMMRSWDQAGADETLTLQHYKECGGAKKALSKQANEIFDGLKPEAQAVAETMFKALSVRRPDGQIVRRPQTKEKLVNLMGGGEGVGHQIERVFDGFSGLGRDFLIRRSGKSRPFDIPHEAILRSWDKLAGGSGWIAQEAKEADTWRGLVHSAANFDKDNENVLRGYVLRSAQEFWARRGNNKDWIQLYVQDGQFSTGLRQAKAVRELIQGSETSARERAKWQKFRLALIVGVPGVLMFSAFIWFLYTTNLSRVTADEIAVIEGLRSDAREAESADDFSTAIERYEDILKIGDDDPDVVSRLSGALFARARTNLFDPEDIQLVRDDANRAVELDPLNQYEAEAIKNPIRLELIGLSNQAQTRAITKENLRLKVHQNYYVVGQGSKIAVVEADKGLWAVETYSLFSGADSFIGLMDESGKVTEVSDNDGFEHSSSRLLVVADGEAYIPLQIGNHGLGGYELEVITIDNLYGRDATAFKRKVAMELSDAPHILPPNAENFISLFDTEAEQEIVGKQIRTEALLIRAQDLLVAELYIDALEDVNNAIELAVPDIVEIAAPYFISDALNSFAWRAFMSGTGPDNIEFVDAALALQPGTAAYLDTRGQILVVQGEWERAIEEFDADIEIRGPSLHSASSRGYAHEKLGNFEQAIADYETALNPKTPDWEDEFSPIARKRAEEGLARLRP